MRGKEADYVQGSYEDGQDQKMCIRDSEREVYLTAGATWTLVHDGTVYEGGQTITVQAPLDVIPVFTKNGSLPELIGLI